MLSTCNCQQVLTLFIMLKPSRHCFVWLDVTVYHGDPYALHLWGRFSVVLHQISVVLHQHRRWGAFSAQKVRDGLPLRTL